MRVDPNGTWTLFFAEYAGAGNYSGSTNALYDSQVVTNHPPGANLLTVTNVPGLSLEIALSDLATNWTDADDDQWRIRPV